MGREREQDGSFSRCLEGRRIDVVGIVQLLVQISL